MFLYFIVLFGTYLYHTGKIFLRMGSRVLQFTQKREFKVFLYLIYTAG